MFNSKLSGGGLCEGKRSALCRRGQTHITGTPEHGDQPMASKQNDAEAKMDLAAAATEAAFGFVSHDGCAIIEHVARDWQAACCIDRGSDETSIGDGK